MQRGLQTQSVQCPYCWESIESVLDPAMLAQLDEGDTSVSYVEDCCVCCHPITLRLTSDQTGLQVSVDEES